MPDVESEPWRLQALCRDFDPEVFFPTGRGGTNELAEGSERAKEVCRRCDVRAECLAFALRTNQDFGVWGGLDEKQRRSYRRMERLRQRRSGRAS